MKLSISGIIDKYLGILLVLCGFSIFLWGGIPYFFGLGRYLADYPEANPYLELLKAFIFPYGPFLMAWMVFWCLPGSFFLSSKVKGTLEKKKRAFLGLWILAVLILIRFLLIALKYKL